MQSGAQRPAGLSGDPRNNAATPAVGFGFAPPVLGQTLIGFTAIDTHLQIPRIDQASVSFEHQLTVDVDDPGRLSGRVGIEPRPIAPGQQRAARPWRRAATPSDSDHPVRARNRSRPAASRCDGGRALTFPVGPINLLESRGKSQYNSSGLLGKRTFSGGLSFLASYTYADSLTDRRRFARRRNEAEVPQNSFDPAADWGPSGCDIRHRFVEQRDLQGSVSRRRAASPRGEKIAARRVRRMAGVPDLSVAERLSVHGQRLRRHGKRRLAPERQPDPRQRRPRRLAGVARTRTPRCGSTRRRS